MISAQGLCCNYRSALMFFLSDEYAIGVAEIVDIAGSVLADVKFSIGIFSGGQSVPYQITPHDCPGPPDPAQAVSIDRFAMFDAQADGD